MNSIVQNLNYLGFAPRGTWDDKVEKVEKRSIFVKYLIAEI